MQTNNNTSSAPPSRAKTLALQLAMVFKVNPTEASETALDYIRAGHLFLAAAMPPEVYRVFIEMVEAALEEDGAAVQRVRKAVVIESQRKDQTK